MPLYEDQFLESHDFPRVDAPSKILIIASTARSGSHMLGHALYQTKKFGFPLEYTTRANLAEWKRRLEMPDFQAVMAEVQRRRTSPNGVFSIKIHYPNINEVWGGFERLTKYFPGAYYILLSRKDVLRQAVSLSIAKQTGVCISGQKPTNLNPPKYEFAQIDQCLGETILNNASWRYALAAGGCNYIEIDHDDVLDNLEKSVEIIASFSGVVVDASEMPGEQVTKAQSNQKNAEWATRFISEFNKSNELLRNSKSSLAMRIKQKIKRIMHA